MKPVRTDKTNTVLTLPGAGPEANLPATRVLAYNPDLGETEADASPAYESYWTPDEGERRALANGAPIVLTVTSPQHPPVSIEIGEPDPASMEAVLVKAHADRAIGVLFLKLAEALAGDDWPDPEGCVELWHTCLEETREGAVVLDLAERVDALQEKLRSNGNGNGDGPS